MATDALLQRKGGRIALITTAGFEDVLAIGRQTRRNLYALNPKAGSSSSRPYRGFGLKERTLASGRVQLRVSRPRSAGSSKG